jgi:hypothetical protein
VPAVIDNAELDRALAFAAQDRRASNAPPVAAPSGDGGGAFGAFWLLALASAAVALRASRLPPSRR